MDLHRTTQHVGVPMYRERGQRYRCPLCGQEYGHDAAYHHAMFECPKRDERESNP